MSLPIDRLGALTPAPAVGPRLPAAAAAGEQPTFAEALHEALSTGNTLQIEAGHQAELLAAGLIDDAHTVTIAAERASLALQLTVAVRNKALEAYQEIMRMQV